MPAMIEGHGKGQPILKNICTGVTPLACPSSTNSRGVWRIPSEVRRIAGGIATITVATSAVAGP